MRIGELARRTGLTVETLRFYERAGLLGKVTRDSSGYRIYDEQTYRTLVTMRWGQELGFRLEDIATFLHRSSHDATTRHSHLGRMIDDRLAVLNEEIAQRNASIASLQLLRAIPFEGECLMPGAFVDELVRSHEERRPMHAVHTAKTSSARTRRRRRVGH